MIKLNYNSWHARLFMQIQEAWDAFVGKDDIDRENKHYDRTDICRYIRAWVLKLPLLLALQLGFLVYMLYVIVIYPLTYAGAAAYGTFWIVVGCIVAAVVTFGVIMHLFGWLGSKLKEARRDKEQEELEEEKAPGLWEMFKQWIQDKHDKICTTVVINGDR